QLTHHPSSHPTCHTPPILPPLHGTDGSLAGSAPSFREIVAYSIQESDGLTAVPQNLSNSTRTELGVTRDIAVIPNFLDCATYRRHVDPTLRRRFAPEDGTKLVMHMSNFRPVKRVDRVIETFARIARDVPARLLLVGDGPELSPALRLGRELGLSEQIEPLGAQEAIMPL